MLFLNVGHALTHFSMLIFPTAVLGMQSTFPMPFSALIGLAFGGFLAFGLGSLPMGWLGDLWSRPAMLGVFFNGLGFSVVLTGLATTPAQFAIGLTFVGLFASIYHPIGTAMVVAGSQRMGHDLGVNGLFGNAGVALAALVSGLLTQFLGWRWAFLVPGMLSCVVGVAYLRWLQNQRPVKATGSPAVPVEVPDASVEINAGSARRALGVIAILTLTGGVVFTALTLVLPQLLTLRLPMLAGSPGLAGLAVSLIYALGAVGQLLVGRTVDRFSLKNTFLPLAFLQAPLLLALFVAGPWATLAVAALLVFVVFGQVTVNDTMVAVFTSDRLRSRMYALRYFLSFTVSAAAVKLVELTYEGPRQSLFQATLVACGIGIAGAALLFRDPGAAPTQGRRRAGRAL